MSCNICILAFGASKFKADRATRLDAPSGIRIKAHGTGSTPDSVESRVSVYSIDELGVIFREMSLEKVEEWPRRIETYTQELVEHNLFFFLYWVSILQSLFNIHR